MKSNLEFSLSNREELINKGLTTLVNDVEGMANKCLDVGYTKGYKNGIITGIAIVGFAGLGVMCSELAVYWINKKKNNNSNGRT